ncbi:MAG: carbohydrate ABC transporter permease [Clostridia bacterium]|nr:carbohydrate ABC transporter permease [Clostridia bacterium]
MSLNNYIYLLSGNADSQKYFMWYGNSLELTIITVILTLLICYFVAYGMTMYRFKLGKILFFLVIATMCVPFEILLLPLYNEVTELGIINTIWGVMLPGLCSASTIFFRQYLIGMPKEMLEAARIDGCTEYGIFRRYIPLPSGMIGACRGLMGALFLFVVSRLRGQRMDVQRLRPSLLKLIFLLFQKYLIEGMTAGAVKG